jgi:hypothetical protein
MQLHEIMQLHDNKIMQLHENYLNDWKVLSIKSKAVIKIE